MNIDVMPTFNVRQDSSVSTAYIEFLLLVHATSS